VDVLVMRITPEAGTAASRATCRSIPISSGRASWIS
jgi:hypothetical protein